MKLKHGIAVFLTIILMVSLLSGCGNHTGSGETVVVGGPDPNKALLVIGNETVTVGEFQYYVFDKAREKAYSIDWEAAKDLAGFDWNMKTESGVSLSDEIIELALNTVIAESVMIDKARANGVALTDEEKKNNDQMVMSYISQNGEENFLLSANAMAVNSVEDYKNLVNRIQAVEVAKNEIIANLADYMDPEIDLSGWRSDEMVTAQHVLIMSNSEKHADPEATAQEVLARAKAGEDFAALIAEYNEDPGATEAGYTFGPGEMVKEFEEASFALECGEISDVVKTEYGYHVIKRLAGFAELQNYWAKNVDYIIHEELLDEISVEKIMEAVNHAQKKLQEQNKSNTAKETK